MSKEFLVRKASPSDASDIDHLLSEWFDWTPNNGRIRSIEDAIAKRQLLVATQSSNGCVVGFIHYVLHEDIIDGGPNSFISAFYISTAYQGKGIGTLLLEAMIQDSLAKGAVGVETSTIHANARKFYEKHHFKQTQGDIGEVFLELDVAEYLQEKTNRRG